MVVRVAAILYVVWYIMQFGTYGSVKGMTPEEVKKTVAQIVLLRPGQKLIKLHVILHNFMQWHGHMILVVSKFLFLMVK